jgi:hypothetical protein
MREGREENQQVFRENIIRAEAQGKWFQASQNGPQVDLK